MILIFVFIIMALLGFIIVKRDIGDEPDITGGSMIVLGLTSLIISLLIIIGMHATANKNIQKNKINYEGLCKRYEIVKSEYEDVSKSDVIADITAWNMGDTTLSIGQKTCGQIGLIPKRLPIICIIFH